MLRGPKLTQRRSTRHMTTIILNDDKIIVLSVSPATGSDGPGVSGRLRALSTLVGLPDTLNRWAAPADPDHALDALIGAAARVLAARDDAPIAFCHAVTAPAAVRLVLPELAPALLPATIATTWATVGGIVAAFAAPRLPDEAEQATEAPTPDQVIARGIEAGDEHAIKAGRGSHAVGGL